MNKTVKVLLPSVEMDMDGFPIKQPLPTQKVEQIDPFLLLHHAQVKFSNRKLAKHQGVGPHPHRGFSPVTFVIEGEVQHRDSRGNNQIAKKGEVQWINAGAGIIHSERPSEDLLKGTRRQEIIQLWINTPANRKMLPPSYHYATAEDMTKFFSDDKKVKNKLIAGRYSDQVGNIPVEDDLLIIWGESEKEGVINYQVPEGFNSMLYVIKGQVSIKGYGLVDAEHLVYFNKEGSNIELLSKEDNSQFLLLCGKPINEKLTQHGPFVMNTQTEILEAMRDYQMGKMGILIED